MILSDSGITAMILAGRIRVEPAVRPEDLRPAGIRVYLADNLLEPVPGKVVDASAPDGDSFRLISIKSKEFILEPGRLVLGATREFVFVDRGLLCLIDGRSTLARLGLTIHLGSSVFDNVHEEPRFVTLELFNAGPFRLILRVNMPIGMLLFSLLEGEIQQAAQDQYRSQLGVTAPRLGALTSLHIKQKDIEHVRFVSIPASD